MCENGRENEGGDTIRIEGGNVARVNESEYLGGMLQSNGGSPQKSGRESRQGEMAGGRSLECYAIGRYQQK